ncbi:NmrA-like family protein [Aaosphaeria arxii CBS 175.79]|uniref:NmrA-like family protein n=1 Tax=Aaosphaeria arxii CBS 175.79 TaxID=1450172 RepID=A0A6A5X963_9PLEO|nr:NmrA-like family protein [Aaosphaeria arxii CBS 175.79]KAF2009471.1 NmrA-like family protein [Aaosphaeria arxii CBS 175.79]
MLILIAGITGFVGLPCAEAALERGHTVRGLSRSPEKVPEDLRRRLEGFEAIEDMYDIAALDRAVAGVDAIICAYSCIPESILEGQLLLLRAAERAGVKNFHASTWNYDWTLGYLGQHEIYDAFISFCAHVRLSSTIKPLYMFTGAIVEWIFCRSAQDWDSTTKTLFYCGDSNATIRYTTARDLAAYTVEAVTSPEASKGGFVRVQSFEASPTDVVEAYNAARAGQAVAHAKCLGTLEDAATRLAEGRANTDPTEFMKFTWDGYAALIGRGVWDYEPQDCARFPNVKQTSLKEWFQGHADV